jgi:hypothetical protein
MQNKNNAAAGKEDDPEEDAGPYGTSWAKSFNRVSQLAKYVLGNIFHLASRQALSMAAGFEGWMPAKSTIWELGLLVLAGVLFFPSSWTFYFLHCRFLPRFLSLWQYFFWSKPA